MISIRVLMLIGIFSILMAGSALATGIGQNVSVTIVPGTLNVSSPVQYSIYDSRMILLNLGLNGSVDYLKYSDNGADFFTICRKCSHYSNKKPFDDGNHTVMFLAGYSSGAIYKNVSFFVDSKNPVITNTEPSKGFAYGQFKVEFKEENPVSVIFYYVNNTRNANITNKTLDIANNCKETQGSYTCKVDVDLSSYGPNIKYWFSVKDIANNTDESKHTSLRVDLAKPVVNNPDTFFNYTKGNNYVHFNMNITESNFEAITYSYIDSRGKLKSANVCQKLIRGFCTKDIVFENGDYDLMVYVSDIAGNSVSIPANFVVDY